MMLNLQNKYQHFCSEANLFSPWSARFERPKLTHEKPHSERERLSWVIEPSSSGSGTNAEEEHPHPFLGYQCSIRIPLTQVKYGSPHVWSKIVLHLVATNGKDEISYPPWLESSFPKISSGSVFMVCPKLMYWGFVLCFNSRCLSSSSRVIVPVVAAAACCCCLMAAAIKPDTVLALVATGDCLPWATSEFHSWCQCKLNQPLCGRIAVQQKWVAGLAAQPVGKLNLSKCISSVPVLDFFVTFAFFFGGSEDLTVWKWNNL